ncbi:hypothetical protein PFICI_03212 [Pestalotiopsis fici W106-1]|uniref:Major facilitator superfamily (MFS) profile domain-containing protein n=1 Tax=Pestalotiopsis fici (strain W106-1 / CGMCC3.15140) TaxID=1229662 RepID=W3XIB4_PESFW|nr:uncharacterized protein PFICI_03212 [Pestalotiopsis fici W106-1]ETS85187.1 hypothetical protein PFICI_03212 [Pestalotiopsis fici W106-1]
MEAVKSGDMIHTDVEHLEVKTGPALEPVGTVKLLDQGDIILIPTPTNEPRDPLNLPNWRKINIVCNVSIFAATATLMASSFGAILPIVTAEYDGDPRVNDLVTLPALFIGIGNFIFVPISHAVGRRATYLFSLTMLVACSIWCACSKSLESHIAGRVILSLAAGQAEALCPIMIQEVYFLHQRGTKIAIFCAAQTLGTAVLTVASSYLAANIGWRWWYGVFACISFACWLNAVFLVPETKFTRTVSAQAGLGHEDAQTLGPLRPITSNARPPIDHTNYEPRTWRHDMALFHGKPNWSEAVSCWKQMAQVICFPNVFWLVLCSGAFLGVFVMFGAVFAQVLVSPPYNFDYEWIGFVFAGQIVVSMVVIPAQGWLSDWLVKLFGKRNGGLAEPETRLIPLIIPFIVAIISTVIFGRACQTPQDWHWSAIVVSFNVEFYGFVGVVVASFTYVIDSYPARSDAALVVLCFARGVISFALSYGSLSFLGIKSTKYALVFDTSAIIIGALGFIGIFVYLWGKKIRQIT